MRLALIGYGAMGKLVENLGVRCRRPDRDEGKLAGGRVGCRPTCGFTPGA